jgi:hypothetical protein
MFDSSNSSSKHISTRLADAADLLIDFATLGEYGFEPVGRAAPSCEARCRPVAPDGTTRRRRLGEAATTTAAPKAPAPRRRHHIDGPFLLRP